MQKFHEHAGGAITDACGVRYQLTIRDLYASRTARLGTENRNSTIA